MALLPIREETIVSSLSVDEIIAKLKSITSPPARSKSDIDPNALFIGNVQSNQFRISIKVNAPQNFIPIIYGSIDKTSMGCIVYLKFKLFFSSIMFLVFWSTICFLVGLFFIFLLHRINLGIIALIAGLTNYIITMFFFQRKVTESYETLLNEL